MSSLCPYCPFEASEGKGGHIRTDSVRRHVQLRHPTPIWDYVDAGGYSNRKVAPTLIIKTRVRGTKTDLNYGFCTECKTSIKIDHIHNNAIKERIVLAHTCKEKATRERRVPVDPTKPRKPKAEFDVYKFMKKLGAEDYCELKEDLDIDMEKTLRNMVRLLTDKKEAAPSTASMVDRIKAEKSLRRWDIDADIKEAQESCDNYDEFHDVLLPKFKDAINSETIRLKQHEVLEGLRDKNYKLEAELENIKIQLSLAQQTTAAFVDPRFVPREDTDSEDEYDDSQDVITHVEDIVIPPTKINKTQIASHNPFPPFTGADLSYGGY